jgi:hypothetical protein
MKSKKESKIKELNQITKWTETKRFVCGYVLNVKLKRKVVSARQLLPIGDRY